MSLRAAFETDSGHRLAFWELTESIAEAENLLCFTSSDRIEYQTLTHEKRQREWLASRLALRNGLAIQSPVHYHPSGQPFVASPTGALSFSHCIPLAGVVVHPATAGIDIQRADPKLLRIKEKFASRRELIDASLSDQELEYLTILWTIKEAVYKVHGSQLPFAEGIQVSRFEIGQSEHLIRIERLGRVSEHQVRSFKLADHWVATVES